MIIPDHDAGARISTRPIMKTYGLELLASTGAGAEGHSWHASAQTTEATNATSRIMELPG